MLDWKMDWNGGMDYGMDYETDYGINKTTHFHKNNLVPTLLCSYYLINVFIASSALYWPH